MTFLWPQLLWLLLVLPALVALYLWAQGRRKKYAVKFPTLGLVRQAAPGPGFRRHVPALLLLGALGVLVFSLSRPVAKVPILASGGLAVLVLDSSGSMRAQDIDPSRIAAAQAAARLFIEKQPSDAVIALVAFAATAYVLQAPTSDKEALLAAVDKLTLQRGTAIGSGLVVALNTILEYRGEPPLAQGFSPFDSSQDDPPGWPSSAPPPLPEVPGEPLDGSVVVLLSDGQSNVGPDPLEVVPLAAQRQLRVYTVGLGDPSGVVLQAEGRRARVVLDEATLQAIADKTKADYFRAGTDTDLKKIYESLGSSLVVKSEKTELTALGAALAVVLLLGSAGLSLFWFHRLP